MSQAEVSASQESTSSLLIPGAQSSENMPYVSLSQISSACPAAPLRERFIRTDHHTYMCACLSRLEETLETLEPLIFPLRDSTFTRTFRCAGLYPMYCDTFLSMENALRRVRMLVHRVRGQVHQQQRSRRQLFQEPPS